MPLITRENIYARYSVALQGPQVDYRGVVQSALLEQTVYSIGLNHFPCMCITLHTIAFLQSVIWIGKGYWLPRYLHRICISSSFRFFSQGSHQAWNFWNVMEYQFC